ncbi:MAG: hypothetical protein KF746_17110 [Chitinophagaceae bacterium]|nr:hypothetical protein [Chitinophagaceae bacterium]
MKAYFTSILICLLFFSCNKSGDKILFKGKFIGVACPNWDVIQVLEPMDKRFKESSWILNDSVYTGAVSAGMLTEQYKTGQPFYFTIKSVTQDIPHPQICSLPKYAIVIESCSDTPPRSK